jgi:hypothetical protein
MYLKIDTELDSVLKLSYPFTSIITSEVRKLSYPFTAVTPLEEAYCLTMCVFTHDKTINHLFFQYNFLRSIWSVIQATLGLYPPTSIANIFGVSTCYWLYIILLRMAAIALIWSLWLCRNGKVFYNKNYTLLQVIYRCTGTLRLWSQLHRMEDHDLFLEVCTRL